MGRLVSPPGASTSASQSHTAAAGFRGDSDRQGGKVRVTNPVHLGKNLLAFRDARRLIEKGRAEWVTPGAVARMIETHPTYQEALKNNISATIQRHVAEEAERARLTDLGSPITEMIRFSHWPSKRVTDSDGRAFLIVEEDRQVRVIPFKSEGKDFGATITFADRLPKRIADDEGRCLYLQPGRFNPVSSQMSDADRQRMRETNSKAVKANQIFEAARDREEAESQSRGSVLRLTASRTTEDYSSARKGNRTKSYRSQS
jgi:hypothetical protein